MCIKYILSYINDSGESYGKYYCEYGLGFFCDIRIMGKEEVEVENGNEAVTEEWIDIHEIISTTFHELGHAAHFTNKSGIYTSTKRVIQESWASFVGYYLALSEYQELGFNYGPFDIGTYNDNEHNQSCVYIVPDYRINRQLVEINSNKRYTPLFIDMHDNDNQYITNIIHSAANAFNQEYYPYDEIRVISASTLEDIVFSSCSISDIKNGLIDYLTAIGEPNINNLSLENINKLFELYEMYY